MSSVNTFAAARGYVVGNVTSETVFAPSGATVRSPLAVRSDISGGILDGMPFRLRAVVKAVPGTSGNFTAAVRFNSGANTNLTTFTSDNVFLTSGAVALGTQAASVFALSAVLVWDSAAQRIAGVNESVCFHTIATPAVLFSGASAVTATNNPVATSVTTVAGLSFIVTGLFGTGNAANAATLLELGLDQI